MKHSGHCQHTASAGNPELKSGDLRAAKAGEPAARDKALAKAQKAYKQAVGKQGEAIKLDPQNYQAANELGFALRKTGDYRKALGAYNFALQINLV